MKRFISLSSSELFKLNKKEILEAIALSEGRTLAAETVSNVMPLLNDISNAELAASMSANILILNMFDVENPKVMGLPQCEASETIRLLKKLTGRLIGINLEPASLDGGSESLWKMTKGRVANKENALKAKELGVDFICITANPGNNVSNKAIVKAIKEIRQACEDLILITGKMHSSGLLKQAGENLVTKEDIKEFIEAGSDIIMLPAPGTVPGICLEYIHDLICFIHQNERLVMTSIGTSQEGADSETIKQIALNCKMAGADIHHIGDSGYVGVALPQNIMHYSIAIRGVRHTYRAMASSINR